MKLRTEAHGAVKEAQGGQPQGSPIPKFCIQVQLDIKDTPIALFKRQNRGSLSVKIIP